RCLRGISCPNHRPRLAPGPRLLHRQGLAPPHNACLARPNLASRSGPAVVLWRHFRTKLPARQIQHRNLPQFLSPPLASRKRRPGETTPAPCQDVRNRRPCRPPVLTTSYLLPAHLLPEPPVAPFRLCHPD